jgi:hypothetical protein
MSPTSYQAAPPRVFILRDLPIFCNVSPTSYQASPPCAIATARLAAPVQGYDDIAAKIGKACDGCPRCGVIERTGLQRSAGHLIFLRGWNLQAFVYNVVLCGTVSPKSASVLVNEWVRRR